MQTIFPFNYHKKIPQGQLTTLTGEEIDYSKGEEAKVRFLERVISANFFRKVVKIMPIFRMEWECWPP